MDLKNSVREALEELKSKSLNEIQVETAVKWAGRAIAAKISNRPDKEVTEFAHESVEHAALSGNDLLLKSIRAAFSKLDIEI